MRNPLIEGQEIELLKISRTKYLAKSNTETTLGDVQINNAYTTLRDNVLVDKDTRVSVYKPTDLRSLFCSFNGITLKLYMYIALSLQKDCDEVKIDFSKFMELSNLRSKTSVYNAIAELQTYSIIQKKHKNVYWINPFLIFNGNRVAYFQTNFPEQIKVVATIKK